MWPIFHGSLFATYWWASPVLLKNKEKLKKPIHFQIHNSVCNHSFQNGFNKCNAVFCKKKLDRIFCHKNTLLRNSFHIVSKWLWSKEEIRQVVNNISCISLCTISLLKIWKYIQWSFWNNLPLSNKKDQARPAWKDALKCTTIGQKKSHWYQCSSSEKHPP